MTTTDDTHSNHSSFSYPILAALLLATTTSFFLGRATAAGRSADPGPTRPAAAGRAPTGDPATEPPPWTRHGFRDDETDEDLCLAPGCNG